MREIKFRAWDNDTNRLVSSHDLFKNFAISSLEISYEFISADFNIELMQYTGIKDKNGKEIYEGDIIEYCVEYPWGEQKTIKKEVIFLDGKYIIGQYKESTYYVDMDLCDLFNEPYYSDIKIIGNIYENPELIKGLK